MRSVHRYAGLSLLLAACVWLAPSGTAQEGAPDREWRSYGKKAGPIRNVTMFQKEKPDVVLAFHDNLEESRGTKHMVEFARRKRTPVELYNSEGRVTE